MKKSILTIQLLIAAFFLSMPLVYSSSYTNCYLPSHVCAEDEPTVACGVQINSVLPVDRAGSNDVTFIANVTLQSNTVITNAFFDFTFESGRTSSLSGSTPEATFPVSCDDKVRSVTVTILAQGGSLFCGDQFFQNFQPGVCGARG
ncbi:MAG: hypothetical protein MJA30_24985 [Cytophagales bacterium]|nr:hypothetical protein [Cytophagales bacterium]